MPLLSRWVRLLLIAVLAIAAVGLLGGSVVASDASVATGTAAAQDGDGALVESCAAEMPDDYADPAGGTADTIGFVDGVWYDEPIDVQIEDGLSESELEALTARTAARAEALRCLTFEDGVPPVDVYTRAELADETGEQFASVSTEERRFDNAVLSTLLFVGAETDSVDVRESARSQTVGGYYSLTEDRIVVVEQEGEGASVDETVLAHEVAHALQDQHFDVERPGNVTMDRDNGLLGLVEGDASLLDVRYLDRCEADRWEQSCVTLGEDGSGSSGSGDGSSSEPPNWGLYLEQYQPYSDGPSFVRSIYRDGGWAAVNATYADVPESALPVMSPETYGSVEFTTPTIEDGDRGDWERVRLDDAPDHERIGPAGIGGMVMAPTFESGGEQGIVRAANVYNFGPDGEPAEVDPLNYGQPSVEGWRGDRLAVFERDGDTAAVWRSTWTDGANADEFAAAYEQLLEYHDATELDGYEGVYEFSATSDHDGAAAVAVDGADVRIVTAPSVEALNEVSAGIASGDGDADDSDADDDDESDSDADDDDASDDGSSDRLPGFGVGAALVAALASALLLARRDR